LDDSKRRVDGYEIIQSVTLNGFQIIIGENPDAEKQYMTWCRSLNEPFGAETHLFPVFSSDYLEVLREFIRTQSVYADSLDLDRVYRGSPVADAALTVNDCAEGCMPKDLKGKVAVIKADVLPPEFRTRSRQLMLVTGRLSGFPGAREETVFGVNIYSGQSERRMRSDILGAAADSAVPGWAREKLAALRRIAEKESVLDKIRRDRTVRKLPDPNKQKPKTHKKDGPER
jgi:hypothetical protein